MTTPYPTPVPAAVPAPRRAWRDLDEGMVGGVAAGLAEHLALPVFWVRVGFLVLVVFGGFGAVLYAGLWIFLPARQHFDDAAPGLAAAGRAGRRPARRRRLVDYGPLIAMGAIAAGLLALVASATGRGFLFWPLLIAFGGVAVLWRQADEAQRDRWVDSTGRINVLHAVIGSGGRASYLRLVVGVAMFLVAIGLFAFRGGDWAQASNTLITSVLALVGIGFVVGPWLFRLVSDLGEERAERVRSQERADMAAHLHDSVLQTLALIQKSAADPAAVTRLARSQERDLRTWLFESPGDLTTLAKALRALAAEVEDAHGVPVEVVCVGDLPVRDELRPLVLATREAVANAARHAGADRVDVYAEVGPAAIEVFVRDRGVGFDPRAIAEDRHGVRDSIEDRMVRHGGTAAVTSTPGRGTEVRLSLPHTFAEEGSR